MAIDASLIVLKFGHEGIKLGAAPQKCDLLPQVRENLVDGDEVVVGVDHVETCDGELVWQLSRAVAKADRTRTDFRTENRDFDHQSRVCIRLGLHNNMVGGHVNEPIELALNRWNQSKV